MNHHSSHSHSGDSSSGSENLFSVTLAKNDEAFPVLKAFQSFLDQERERARRRVVTLSVCFIVALVVLVVLFGMLFATFFSHMLAKNEEQQNHILDLVTRSSAQVAAVQAQFGTAPVQAPQAAPAPAAPAAEPQPAPAPAAEPQPAAPAPAPEPAPPLTGIVLTPEQYEEALQRAEERGRRAAALAAAMALPPTVPPPSSATVPRPPETRVDATEVLDSMDETASSAAASETAAPAEVPGVEDALSDEAPSVPEEPAEESAEAAPEAPAEETPAASEAPLRGVVSSPFRADQERRMAAEEAAFRERAAARAAAAAAAEAADVPEEAAEEEGADGSAEAADEPEEDSMAPRTLRVMPKGTMRVPEGYSTDPITLETPSGAAIRFRTLVPVPDASR